MLKLASVAGTDSHLIRYSATLGQTALGILRTHLQTPEMAVSLEQLN